MLIPDHIRLIDLTAGQLRHVIKQEFIELLSLAMAKSTTGNIETVPIEELSILTGWSKSCIYKKCSLRQIPHHKVGKELRFNMNEINDWIKKKKRKTGDELVADFEDRHKAKLKR